MKSGRVLKMNDLVYNEIVATPGYELEFAVGTTYSLDADIFLALSLAFGRLGEVTDADFQQPLRLLEGLRKATRRMAVFCNRGGLKPPIRKNPLFAMLDKCVFEVASSREPLANFHPKLWIIKERSLENRNMRQIKLIVLSRNLTNDTSLDIAVSMTAPLGVSPDKELLKKHEPLRLLLEQLAPYASKEKRREIKRLIKDMASMGRFELDSRYTDYEFIPIHFGSNLNTGIDLRNEMPGQKMMVVSPFIDKSEMISTKEGAVTAPLWWMNAYVPNGEKVLVTRIESLTPEIMQLYSGEHREVWVMSQGAEQNDIQLMDLHAKMYLSWGPRQGGVYLWLGSVNATYSGFYRNSEFLLRLSLKRGKNLFKNFKDEFCDERKQLCRQITIIPDEIERSGEDQTLAIMMRRNLIFHNNLMAEVIRSEKGFRIYIKAKKLKDIPGTIRIAPIQQPSNAAEFCAETKECVIDIANASDLSEFYILSVKPFEGDNCEEVRMVVKIPTTGIPDDRDDLIFRSLIDTRDKFLNYVEMMITDTPFELAALMTVRNQETGNSATLKHATRETALYESLLKLAAANPERIDDLQDFTDRLDSQVIPESFRQMIETFKKIR